MLIDERARSHAEHTCLFLEAMTPAKFVGIREGRDENCNASAFNPISGGSHAVTA
jgi:hypothetical protein